MAVILVTCSGLHCWTQPPDITDPRFWADLNVERVEQMHLSEQMPPLVERSA